MAANLQEMKKISRLALMKEMVEKTKSCGLIWNQISGSQYLAKYQDYDFLVARSSPQVYTFDVLKEGKMYRSYNSSTQEGVKLLFEEIELSFQDSRMDKYKSLGSFIGRIGTCREITTNTYNIPVAGFGVLASGNTFSQQIRPISPVTLTPISLTFGPTIYPWSGSLSDILTDDGNTTYIRQQVSGEFPTNWGYVFLEFDTSPIINLLPPYQVRVQVSHQREAELGVNLNLDVLVNGAIIYSKPNDSDPSMIESPASYTLFDSTLVDALEGPTYIDSIILRMFMFTNTGNLDPRAIRISYASVDFAGYDPIS